MRQPLAADTDRVVSLEPGKDACGLPVPYCQLSFSVTRHHKTSKTYYMLFLCRHIPILLHLASFILTMLVSFSNM